MNAVTFRRSLSAEQFRQELFACGMLIPTAVSGLYGRNEVFENLVEAVDRLIGRLSAQDGAEIMRFPPIMTRSGFEASGYFKNFPAARRYYSLLLW